MAAAALKAPSAPSSPSLQAAANNLSPWPQCGYIFEIIENKGTWARVECAMSHYRVYYYKNLLSSDGHQFKCLQQQFDLPDVDSPEKAQEIADCQFESLHGWHSLRWFADVIEVEHVNHQQS